MTKWRNEHTISGELRVKEMEGRHTARVHLRGFPLQRQCSDCCALEVVHTTAEMTESKLVTDCVMKTDLWVWPHGKPEPILVCDQLHITRNKMGE